MTERMHSIAVLPGQSAPAPARKPVYDLVRLEELRDRHDQIREDYRRANMAVQAAARGLARLRANAGGTPDSDAVLSKPAAYLGSLTLERLTELQILPQSVQQIIAAEARITRLAAERDSLHEALKLSIQFSSKLETFAREHGL